ncbi:Glycosyltransferase 25 family member [Halotydeus destructor]|nr:Glycosyltransferase 25 family member [Halotydeus destructor]
MHRNNFGVAYLIAILFISEPLTYRCTEETGVAFPDVAIAKVLPTIEVVILVHPYNKVPILPHLFGGLEHQDYPKERLNLYIKTESLLARKTTRQTTLNRLTIKLIQEWVRWNERHYHQVTVEESPIGLDEEDTIEYWTQSRFSRLIYAKEAALRRARHNWADYVLFLDSDVVLVNPHSLTSLMESHSDSLIFGPMLYSLGTYSNFWAGMTENGYYKRTDEYLPILERQKIGLFEVPMIHSCIFINLRFQAASNISFVPKDDHPYDDIIALALTAKELKVPMSIINEKVYGYLAPPMDSPHQNLKQDLVDIELESLVEGEVFPVASSLKSHTSMVNKDKLGMDNIYIINLLRRPERLERMQKTLNVIGLEAQFWPATDGRRLTESKLADLGVKVMPDYKDPYHDRPMTYGEIGCFLSHYFIWKDMLERNFTKVIVFEDDVQFGRDMKRRFAIAIEEIDLEDVDLIYIGRKRQGSEDELRIAVHFVEPSYSYWTIGYLITARGAQKLIKAKPLATILPIDEYLPIMYDNHPRDEWKKFFPVRNLKALSFQPVLITPTHYVGDDNYISDTEKSSNILSDMNNPRYTEAKHTEL